MQPRRDQWSPSRLQSKDSAPFFTVHLSKMSGFLFLCLRQLAGYPWIGPLHPIHVKRKLAMPLRTLDESKDFLQKPCSWFTRMSYTTDDHSRRLERARRQYENLLIHAGDVLVDKDAMLHESAYFEVSAPITPATQRSFRDVKFQSPIPDRLSTSLNDTFEEDAHNGMDKDSIIVSLQEEVYRLRNKLESVVSSVETVIQDAQDAQDEIRAEHERQIYELNKRYARLEDENKQLRVTLDLSQAQLAVEQDNLLKAAKFIERLKRRGREYAEVQRRSNNLVVTTSALCTMGPAGQAKGRRMVVTLNAEEEEKESREVEQRTAGAGAGAGEGVGYAWQTPHMYPAAVGRR